MNMNMNIVFILFFVNAFAFVMKTNYRKSTSFFKLRTTTCFPEEENNRRKKELSYSSSYSEPIIYTLIWYDCLECKELLETMDSLRLTSNYINGGYYFYDLSRKDNKPLFYRDNIFISDELYDIYAEIHGDEIIRSRMY